MVTPPRVLEISIISAHDLALVSKTMKTYSVAWIDPERKLVTGVDQTALNNPTWNEKFVFRVDDRFLTDDTSAIIIEIYAAAWLKDALVGSVRVLTTHLFGTLNNNNNNNSSSSSSLSATRYVALHVRRPSGRPQGIINLGITLLDNNKMRSMPLYAELCGNFSDVTLKDDRQIEARAKLRRSLSDKTDLTSDDCLKNNNRDNQARAAASSVVKGSVLNGSQCSSSDVGPSASVVAAAIAKGLYKTPAPANTSAGDGGGGQRGLIAEELKANEEEEAAGMMKSKVERWRTERPAIYDNSQRRANRKPGGRARRRRMDGGGLFSCFGNAFGCEISITCGGGSRSSNKKKYQNGKVGHLSSVDDNYSQSYV